MGICENLLSIHLTRCIYRQFTDVLFISASGKVRHAGVIPLARAVPSGMAPPASCDDSAKAGAMSDLKKQLLQVVFW